MAETAGSIIKDALQEIVVQGSEAPVEQADAQTAVRYLNRMMATFDAEGIDLGYTEVDGFADAITVAAGAIEGIVFNLAVRLWAQYNDGALPPDDIVAKAIAGKEAMRAIAVTIGATEYPDTLPIGSGNEGDNSSTNSHFYSDLQDDILAESTGSIGLEENTAESTP